MSSSPKDLSDSETENDPLKGNSSKYHEVNSRAVWSLSSCKPGLGVDALLDNRLDTYWQSDGLLPHLINIEFVEKILVSDIYLYMDYKLDESYTPSRISIRAGTHANDLQEVEVLVLTEPSGWMHIPIKNINEKSMKIYMIQIAIMSNHQNGRDTHIRQVKIYTPHIDWGFKVDKRCIIKHNRLNSIR